jgi:Protein of unknown function (DUF4238)
LAAFTAERPPTRETIRSFIRERHKHDPAQAEVEAAWNIAAYLLMQDDPPTFDDIFSISLGIGVNQTAPLLQGLHWRVDRTNEPILWTSDRPVMAWRPPSPRDSFEGVGYANCDEIRFPLSPTAMLVMSRTASISPRHVKPSIFHDYNDDIAAQCFEYVICHAGRAGRLGRIPMAPSRPAVQFNTGPGFRVDPDGSQSPMGDVLHTWSPIRATATASHQQ